MYSRQELTDILTSLISLPAENEVVEFKHAENSFSDQDLGEYFSALSNEANLKGRELAWLVFGVENKTHRVLGTNYKPTRPSLDAMKKKIADQATNRITFDEIYELNYECKRVIMFQIPAAPQGIPVAYQGHYYGRDICERRGSGYDRAVEAIEKMYLPAYKVQSGDSYTRVFLYPQKSVKDMSKEEKIIACYQHACLLYENDTVLTNQSVRERFGLDKNKNSVASRIISETLEKGLLKPTDEENTSRKFTSYIPYYG